MPIKERHRQQLLEAAAPLLMQGEQVEITTCASVGSVSVGKRVLTAAVVGVVSAGMLTATVQPRPMYLVLTDQRILFFDNSSQSRKPGKLLMNLPRPYLTASDPKKGMFGLTLVATLSIEQQEKGLKLTFPAPCREEGRRLLSALPITR